MNALIESLLHQTETTIVRNSHPDVEALRGLYTPPTAAKLAKDCREIADATAAQLETLAADPTPERCERVALQLEGVRQHVNRLRDQLQRETHPENLK